MYSYMAVISAVSSDGILHVFMSIYVQISPFHKTESYWIMAHPNDFILMSSSAKTLFPNKLTFTHSGGRTSTSFHRTQFIT